MKKPVVLLIAIIYVLSIIVVGFIGIKMKVYNQIVYVEQITCVSENYKKYETKTDDCDGYIKVNYQEGLRVLLKCEITPNNATNKKLNFTCAANDSVFKLTTNEDDGTAYVSFYRGGSVTVTISSDDGRAKTRIKVIAIDIGDII